MIDAPAVAAEIACVREAEALSAGRYFGNDAIDQHLACRNFGERESIHGLTLQPRAANRSRIGWLVGKTGAQLRPFVVPIQDARPINRLSRRYRPAGRVCLLAAGRRF